MPCSAEQSYLHNGREYVKCGKCGGWYELRGFRGMHKYRCDGTCTEERESPPFDKETAQKSAVGDDATTQKDMANSTDDGDEFESESEGESELETLSLGQKQDSDSNMIVCDNCDASDYVPAERAKQDMEEMGRLTDEVEQVLTDHKYYCNKCFHAFDE